MAELQEREQQALLDKLEATERRFWVQLERREEELRDMEESLRLMREEAACPCLCWPAEGQSGAS